jgi:predicted NBD/HSP70 family sugar kinase
MVELAQTYLKKQKGSSLAARTKEGQLTPLMIYEEAFKKDETALAIMDEYSAYLGIGIVNIINIFNPEAIFLGGGISQAFRIFLPVVKRMIKERACPVFKDNVQLYAVKEPDKLPAFGAAKIAINSTNA